MMITGMKLPSVQIFVALLLCMIVRLNAGAEHLIDSETKSSLPLASITDCNGNVIGMTDRDGNIPAISAESFPVTFNFLGYLPLEVACLTGNDIEMRPTQYELPEIEIVPGSRPLLYLTGYMREYVSALGSSDSLTVFRESIVDFLMPVEKTKVKGWNSPRRLADKTYIRLKDSEGVDSVSNHLNEDFLLWGDMVGFFPSVKKIPERIKNGQGYVVDTIMGKYSPKFIWRKNGNIIRCNLDALADEKDHISSPWALKLLGLTTDISEMSLNCVFHTDEGAQLKPTDMSRISISIDMLVKGKLFKRAFDSKKPVDLKSYVEVYIIDREYLTDEQAKEIKKIPPVVSSSAIVAPTDAPALHSGIRKIVDRVNAQSNK